MITIHKLLTTSLVVTLTLHCQISVQDGSERAFTPLTGEEASLPNQDCSETILLSDRRPTFRIEPDPEYFNQSEAKCDWVVIGHETCRPALKCSKLKLTGPPGKPEGDPCPDEFLDVTDGAGGYQKFCGGNTPEKTVPNSGLRELYIRFRGHKDPASLNNKGIKCVISCSDGVGEKPLELNSEQDVNKMCNCGRKKNKNRIVGGENAARGDFPWIVALVTAGTRRPFCGGTIISSQFVLTAAHCFKGPYVNKNKLELLGSSVHLDVTSTQNTPTLPTPDELAKADLADESHRFEVDKYFIHPLYVRQTNDFDVAIIKLKKPIDFLKTPELQPACLPNLGQFNRSLDGVNAVVAGWGLNNASSEQTMAILQKLDVTIFSTDECRKFFDERFNKRMLCAGYKEGGKDSCKGDSGGPLIVENKQIWDLVGAVSWGEGCAGKFLPGVYVRITEINQWVHYIVNKEDGIWCLK